MIALLLQYRYFIIIPLTLIEGPIVMTVCGFLLRLGYFSFLPLYFCLVFSDLAADLIWYGLGYFFGQPFVRKFGHFFSITEENVSILKRFFHRYQNKILVISKLTTGFGFAVATLFTAGLVKISFKRYVLLNLFGEFIWTGMLMAIGYYLGDVYAKVNNLIGKLFILAMIVLLLLALFGFGKYLKGRITKAYS